MALLFAAGVACAAATLTGFLGHLDWRLDLTAHFRAQYAVVLLVVASGFVGLRRWWTAAAFGLALVVNLLLLAPLFTGGNGAVEEGAGNEVLRVAVMNLSVGNRDARAALAEIARWEPDVLVFLEYTPRWARAMAGLRDAYPHRVEDIRSDPFGIALLSREPLDAPEVLTLVPRGPPSIIATIRLEGRPLELLATHPFPPIRAAGTALRNDQLVAAAGLVSSRSGPVAVLGDLNASYWSHAFRRLVDDTGLRPAALGHGLHPTWPVDVPPLMIPIDHVLIPLVVVARDFDTGRPTGSDHLSIRADLTWRTSTR